MIARAKNDNVARFFLLDVPLDNHENMLRLHTGRQKCLALFKGYAGRSFSNKGLFDGTQAIKGLRIETEGIRHSSVQPKKKGLQTYRQQPLKLIAPATRGSPVPPVCQ
jgi:hypothetical protein